MTVAVETGPDGGPTGDPPIGDPPTGDPPTGDGTTGDDIVVVEGPTVGPRPGVHPLVVETGRVVLGVALGSDARLVVLRDGRIEVSDWVLHDLDAVEAAQAREGRRLLSRDEDREGSAWHVASPWHVSRFAPAPETVAGEPDVGEPPAARD